MTTKPIHFIDFMSVMSTADNSKMNLSTVIDGKEVRTNGIYGLMKLLTGLITAGEDFIIFNDSKTNVRKELNEFYKAGRPSRDEFFWIQHTYALKLFSQVGIPVIAQEGIEADDLIVEAARTTTHRPVLVHSGDYDMLQTVSPNVSFKNVAQNRKIMFCDYENFENLTGVPYNAWLFYRSLVGDNSDRLPGVKGVGEQRAKKFIYDLQNVAEIDFQDLRKNSGEIDLLREYLDDEDFAQAKASLDIMLPQQCAVEVPESMSINYQTLVWWLQLFEMKSLVRQLEQQQSMF